LGFGICGMFSLIIIQIWSFIADINTMNISQSHHLLIMTEYLVDQKKYLYWILLYMYTVLYIASIIMLGTGTMFITYIEHICGIFKIARMTKHFMITFEITMSCITGCLVVCFSFNLTNVSESLSSLVFASVCIIYMFIANYIGQNIIDHNNNIFVTAYNVQWYRMPLHIQKVILFLLQRNTKKFVLSVGGIFDGTVKHFATVI
ncbi:hypothetical protein ALC53_09793, partial [Atta colombica]